MVSPAIGTVIRGTGRVVRHDVTVHDLHRLCVELHGEYPDLETWAELVQQRRTIKTWLHSYSEKMTSTVLNCYLWIYWKEG